MRWERYMDCFPPSEEKEGWWQMTGKGRSVKPPRVRQSPDGNGILLSGKCKTDTWIPEAGSPGGKGRRQVDSCLESEGPKLHGLRHPSRYKRNLLGWGWRGYRSGLGLEETSRHIQEYLGSIQEFEQGLTLMGRASIKRILHLPDSFLNWLMVLIILI